MARRPDDAIAVGPVGILGIVIGYAKVERGGDVHDGERAARRARMWLRTGRRGCNPASM